MKACDLMTNAWSKYGSNKDPWKHLERHGMKKYTTVANELHARSDRGRRKEFNAWKMKSIDLECWDMSLTIQQSSLLEKKQERKEP